MLNELGADVYAASFSISPISALDIGLIDVDQNQHAFINVPIPIRNQYSARRPFQAPA